MTTMAELVELIEDQSKTMMAAHEKRHAEYEEMKSIVGDIQKKANRPSLGGSGPIRLNSPERKALDGAVRALIMGDQAKANHLFGEAKAMTAGSDPEGGYVVHSDISSGMTKVMIERSPFYRLARKIDLVSGTFEEPIDRDAAEAAWVGEVQARPDTETPDLGKFTVECNEIYAMPKASQKLVDIASIDVLGWLQEKIGDAFAVKEADAFHNGDGIARPRGILTYTTASTSDASRAWGTFQHVPTGASGAFHTTKADPLIDLVGALKPQYRIDARWLMNRATMAVIRKMKEATSDRYLLVDSLVIGEPAALLGYPVEIDEDMPDISAGSLSIAFGSVSKAYTIVQKPGVKFLTDPFTDKPNIRLYGYRRVGGGANNTEALKFLKFAAT